MANNRPLGARVALSARSADLLNEIAANTEAIVAPLDITDVASVRAATDTIKSAWGEIDLVLVRGRHARRNARRQLRSAARKKLDPVLPMLLAQGHGGIAIVASVAGYRGLPKALIYGPTKAALINLAESLYLDLQPRGIGVYLINPGFVDTPLTQKNDLKMPALMPADQAARATLAGIAAGAFEIHYPKRFTRWLRLASPALSRVLCGSAPLYRRLSVTGTTDPRAIRVSSFGFTHAVCQEE